MAWGPFGALLLAFLDGAGIPAVDLVDVMLLTLGSQNPVVAYISAALAVCGSIAGSLGLFYIGRKGGEEYIDKRTQTGWPRRFRRWYHHYGLLTVFIPALLPLPLPLKIFVLCAGALGIDRHQFILVMLAARVPRYFGEAFLGSQLGTKPMDYVKSHMLVLLAIAVGLFLFLYLLIKLKDRHHRRTQQNRAA